MSRYARIHGHFVVFIVLSLLAYAPSPSDAEPNRDGVIESGEYENSKVFGNGHFEVHWTLDGDRVFFGLRAQTTGYLAMGFEPTAIMKDIDVVMGRVVDGEGETMDGYSTAQFGPPEDDKDQGGSDDVDSSDAEEVGGWTTVEFRRDLDTGDGLDHVIPDTGNMTIVWATGPTDDWTQRHSRAGEGFLKMGGGGSVEPPPAGGDLDGVISDGEYPFMVTAAGNDLELHWKVEGTTVQFGIKARTNGWVAIGLEPTTIMKDADMYFGWVQGGTPTAVDAWSTGAFGPHPRDTDQGGTHDITSYGATESGGWTTLELLRDLDTGDAKDRRVPAIGKLDVIWAVGVNDDWNEQHSMRGSMTIDMGTGEAQVDEGFPRWSLHAILMLVGVALMFWGFAIVRKKEKGWMDRHRKVMTTAAVFGGLGLLFGIGMVIQSGGPHLRLPHTWLGAVTLAVAMVTLAMGYGYTKVEPKRKKAMRKPKIWMGRITVGLMVATTMLGALTVLLGL